MGKVLVINGLQARFPLAPASAETLGKYKCQDFIQLTYFSSLIFYDDAGAYTGFAQ